MGRRSPPEPEVLTRESLGLQRTLAAEDALGCVVIGNGFLESVTGTLLVAYFVKDKNVKELFESDNAVLGTFSARIKIAYYSGLISVRAFNDLLRFAGIRNIFAHARARVDFTNTDVTNHCKALTWPMIVGEPFYRLKGLPIGYDLRQLSARDKYELCLVYTFNHVLIQTHSVAHRPRVP
jgi:hypothetical protein